MIQERILCVLTNPKKRDNIYGKADWYPYYAGYAQEFVADVIDALNIKPGQIILDPWNGSGTTTQVATQKGIQSYGVDLNPVMVIVAQAKLLSNVTSNYLIEIASNIVRKASSYKKPINTSSDLLNYWFRHQTIRVFQKLEFHILKETEPNPTNTNTSCLRAFFQVALFRTLKSLLLPFKSSNPTWIKKAKSDEERLIINPAKIYNLFLTEVNLMAGYFNDFDLTVTPSDIATIKLGNSTNLDFDDDFADHIITSPPYCTRIDYVVATLPELSLLHPQGIDYNTLRKEMIGTNLMQNLPVTFCKDWGVCCKSFLNQVAAHESKASKGYYLKTFLQYFDSFYHSLIEMNRVLKKNGTCTLVVQSSYYKNILLSLPCIIKEMTLPLGWECIYEFKFNNKVSFSHVNTGSLKYKKPTAAIETILIFRKGND